MPCPAITELPAPLPRLDGGTLAGDWIKFETSTLDKPEIGRLAELLNEKPEYAVGLCVRFWVWFDRNARNGSVTHVFAKSIESLMNCPGFVGAMTDIGWLKLDEHTHVLTIPNADRHNGRTAKSRALARDRMQKFRNADVTPPLRKRNATVTQSALLEKRRESIKGEVDEEPKRNGNSTPAEISALASNPDPPASDDPTPEQTAQREAEKRRQLALVAKPVSR
jgi:hypothetical protein